MRPMPIAILTILRINSFLLFSPFFFYHSSPFPSLSYHFSYFFTIFAVLFWKFSKNKCISTKNRIPLITMPIAMHWQYWECPLQWVNVYQNEILSLFFNSIHTLSFYYTRLRVKKPYGFAKPRPLKVVCRLRVFLSIKTTSSIIGEFISSTQ